MIDVANELSILNFDIKKFSHKLREFENFVHPYEPVTSGLLLDEHSSKVFFRVLKAALESIVKKRK